MSDLDRHDWGWGTWLGMGLMMTVLTVLVLAAAVLVVRATTGPQKTATSLRHGPRGTRRATARQRGAAGAARMSGSRAVTSTKASTSPAGTCPADARDPHPGRRTPRALVTHVAPGVQSYAHPVGSRAVRQRRRPLP